MITQWLSDLVGQRVEVETGDSDYRSTHRGTVRAIGVVGDSVMIALELVTGTLVTNASSRVADSKRGSPAGALALFRWGYSKNSDGCAVRVVSDAEAHYDYFAWGLSRPPLIPGG